MTEQTYGQKIVRAGFNPKANAEAIQTIAFILNGGQGAKTGLIVGNVTDKGF